ncbi:SDR family oxidoreductase [Flavobacterium sp.]|uniref:SDR family oxidoreductase n=1 Tax=Flavobacterium sp. TaxID=239 RepID=UPI003B9C23EF
MSKILITGASGTNGKALAEVLTNRRVAVKLASRNPLPTNEYSEYVPFDFADVSTFEAAVADVDRVFLLGPPLQFGIEALLTPFIDFLKEKGINRVVYFSAFASEKMGDNFEFHLNLEKKLAADGFAYTILRPSFFAQNFKNYEFENITQRNIIFMPAGLGKAAFVDVYDIAEVAAKALTEDGHEHKTYELTGPELLTYEDLAAYLTEILGKKITYPNPTPEVFRQVLVDSGAPEFVANYLISVYGVIAKKEAEVIADGVELVLGRKATDVKTVLKRDFKG